MSVVSCEPAYGDFNAMPIPGIDTEFSIPYVVVCDSVSDNPATIFASGLLPARWTVYDDNVFATCRRVSVHRERHSPLVWRATAYYSSAPITQEEEEKHQKPDPIERAAEIEWDATPYQSPVYVDICGRTILNSAGEAPDPVPEKTDYYHLVTITKKVPARPDWLLDYPGVVNSEEFVLDDLTIPLKCARLVVLRLSKKQREGTFHYRTLTMGIELRQRRTNNGVALPLAPQPEDAFAQYYTPASGSAYPFDLELPDIGLHEWTTGAGSPKKRIMTDDSPPRPVAQPVPLDGLGHKLASPTIDTSKLFCWRLYPAKTFAVLPLT